MKFSGWICGSCAANGIEQLGNEPDAVTAMSNFCRQQLGEINGFTKAYQPLFNFYVFVAGPEVPLGEPGGGYHSKAWVKYGTEFAEFINKNGLGVVATVPAKLNLKFHPTTKAQIWIWSPDQDAVVKWWNNQQAEVARKKQLA